MCDQASVYFTPISSVRLIDESVKSVRRHQAHYDADIVHNVSRLALQGNVADIWRIYGGSFPRQTLQGWISRASDIHSLPAQRIRFSSKHTTKLRELSQLQLEQLGQHLSSLPSFTNNDLIRIAQSLSGKILSKNWAKRYRRMYLQETRGRQKKAHKLDSTEELRRTVNFFRQIDSARQRRGSASVTICDEVWIDSDDLPKVQSVQVSPNHLTGVSGGGRLIYRGYQQSVRQLMNLRCSVLLAFRPELYHLPLAIVFSAPAIHGPFHDITAQITIADECALPVSVFTTQSGKFVEGAYAIAMEKLLDFVEADAGQNIHIDDDAKVHSAGLVEELHRRRGVCHLTMPGGLTSHLMVGDAAIHHQFRVLVERERTLVLDELTRAAAGDFSAVVASQNRDLRSLYTRILTRAAQSLYEQHSAVMSRAWRVTGIWPESGAAPLNISLCGNTIPRQYLQQQPTPSLNDERSESLMVAAAETVTKSPPTPELSSHQQQQLQQAGTDRQHRNVYRCRKCLAEGRTVPMKGHKHVDDKNEASSKKRKRKDDGGDYS